MQKKLEGMNLALTLIILSLILFGGWKNMSIRAQAVVDGLTPADTTVAATADRDARENIVLARK